MKKECVCAKNSHNCAIYVQYCTYKFISVEIKKFVFKDGREVIFDVNHSQVKQQNFKIYFVFFIYSKYI